MEIVLEVKNINKSFSHNKKTFTVLKDISFVAEKGEIIGIIGKSGIGKLTLMNIIAGFEKADSGEIIKPKNCNIHMIFQSPIESLNPKIKIGKSIMERMINKKIPKKDAYTKCLKLLYCCGLDRDIINKYPHQLSGGQAQRVSIARALACEPDILICDEAINTLDVLIQFQVLELLKKINHDKQITILFVCHDIDIVNKFCTKILELK